MTSRYNPRLYRAEYEPPQEPVRRSRRSTPIQRELGTARQAASANAVLTPGHCNPHGTRSPLQIGACERNLIPFEGPDDPRMQENLYRARCVLAAEGRWTPETAEEYGIDPRECEQLGGYWRKGQGVRRTAEKIGLKQFPTATGYTNPMTPGRAPPSYGERPRLSQGRRRSSSLNRRRRTAYYY